MRYAKLIPTCAAVICAALAAPSVAAGPCERAGKTPRFPIDLTELRAAETERFHAADADGDGGVDVSEFAKLRPARLMADRQWAAAGRGLGKHAKRHRRAATKAARAERRRRVFERLDKDANGTLTAEEFPSASARLERLDANGDGLVTRGEMPKRRRR